MILILTPVYKNYEVTKRMCEAIDRYTVNPYRHILIDDNSKLVDLPVEVNEKRRIIKVHSDVYGVDHKNQLGQMVQLGYDYAKQKYWNAEEQVNQYSHVFMIESDVIVGEGWDQKMIDYPKPSDWATLDCVSVDEDGKVTYPSTVAPVIQSTDKMWEREYPEFQCTLFNDLILELVPFSNFPSHFDILFGREITKLTGRKHYETKEIEVLHVHGGGNSRSFL